MKIVFLTPDTVIDRRIMLQAKSLARKGFEISIIADTGSENISGAESVSIKHVIQKNITSGTLAGKLKHPLKTFFAGQPAIKRLIRKTYFNLHSLRQYLKEPFQASLHPYSEAYAKMAVLEAGDLYIACDLPMLAPTAFAARKTGKPFLYDAHEYYTGQSYLSYYEQRLAGKVEKALIGKAAKVITINESIAALLQKDYGLGEIAVVYNCTEAPQSFQPQKTYNLLREKLRLPDSRKLALYQGGLITGRNLETLAESSHFLEADKAIVMMGYGEHRSCLEKLGKPDRLFFLEAVGQEELLSHTASAQAGVIPYQPIDANTKYCTPNKLFEFIQAGLPCLASENLCEVNRFLTRYDAGVTADLSHPKRIAAALNKLLDDSTLLRRLRENSLKAACELNWNKESEKFCRIAEKALTEKPVFHP